jgi:hypothetical protein
MKNEKENIKISIDYLGVGDFLEIIQCEKLNKSGDPVFKVDCLISSEGIYIT